MHVDYPDLAPMCQILSLAEEGASMLKNARDVAKTARVRFEKKAFRLELQSYIHVCIPRREALLTLTLTLHLHNPNGLAPIDRRLRHSA